jgi:hypothetical protein
MTLQDELRRGVAVAAKDLETSNKIAEICQVLKDWQRQQIVMAFKPRYSDVRVIHRGLRSKHYQELRQEARKHGWNVLFNTVSL